MPVGRAAAAALQPGPAQLYCNSEPESGRTPALPGLPGSWPCPAQSADPSHWQLAVRLPSGRHWTEVGVIWQYVAVIWKYFAVIWQIGIKSFRKLTLIV